MLADQSGPAEFGRLFWFSQKVIVSEKESFDGAVEDVYLDASIGFKG